MGVLLDCDDNVSDPLCLYIIEKVIPHPLPVAEVHFYFTNQIFNSPTKARNSPVMKTLYLLFVVVLLQWQPG